MLSEPIIESFPSLCCFKIFPKESLAYNVLLSSPSLKIVPPDFGT